MATAYTPGLKVTRSALITKMRRLPLAGNVIVKPGQHVEPDDVLARAELPGIMRTVRAAELLGLEPNLLQPHLLVKEGDQVSRGDILCRSTSFFGMFKNEVKTPVTGVVELINPLSGNIGIREAPLPVEVKAYIKGEIVEVIPGEGAHVQTTGALIQGIFGVGGERNGPIKIIAASREEILRADSITSECEGRILVGGAGADLAALKAAADAGAKGLLVGGVLDSDLIEFLGHDIGVAITGQENIGLTLILTEGFGHLAMAHRTWDLLKGLDGKWASVNGATQIRAGVIRPELIVPGDAGSEAQELAQASLDVGCAIRLIREPHFGKLATVADLPADLQSMPSGARVRVLVAKLQDGEQVTVPRANVELIEN